MKRRTHSLASAFASASMPALAQWPLVVFTLTSGVALAQNAAETQARLLASNCANCHGTDGRSQGGMPALNGQSKAKIVEAMQDFRSGKRVATIMHQLSKGYTDAEIDLLAGYFASQK